MTSGWMGGIGSRQKKGRVSFWRIRISNKRMIRLMMMGSSGMID